MIVLGLDINPNRVYYYKIRVNVIHAKGAYGIAPVNISYYTFMHIKDKEYHEFGPWLLEIKAPEDIPPQYIEETDQILSASYAFKVPVLLVRREIRPGALMYNQVVMLFKDHIAMLEYDEGALRTREMKFSEMEYTIHGGELLSSYMKFSGVGDSMKITYNSVSNDVTEHVMDHIRRAVLSFKDLRGRAEESQNDGPHNDQDLELDGSLSELKDSQIYKYFCIKEVPKTPLEIIAYQPFVNLTEHLPIRLPYFLEKFYMYKLNDTLFMTSPNELIIANRDRTIQKSGDVNYAFAHTFIPLAGIQSVHMVADDKFEALGIIEIELEGLTNVRISVENSFDISRLQNALKRYGR